MRAIAFYIRFSKSTLGMPEMLKPTSLIMGAGLGLDVACITDGRFSGGSVSFLLSSSSIPKKNPIQISRFRHRPRRTRSSSRRSHRARQRRRRHLRRRRQKHDSRPARRGGRMGEEEESLESTSPQSPPRNAVQVYQTGD